MANNHGADYGAVGLRDTLAAKRTSPIPIVGIGADQTEAFAPATLEAKGLRVAVFGASQVYEMTLANWSADEDSPGIASAAPTGRLRRAVEKAAQSHDLVVVFMHWGLDYQTCPDGLSASTAQTLADAGADVVVGGHSHRVNGAGWLGSSYVAYGLGNFVWWRSREPDSRTGVLTLSVDVRAAQREGRRTQPRRDRRGLDPDARRHRRHTPRARRSRPQAPGRGVEAGGGLFGAVADALTTSRRPRECRRNHPR